MKIKFLFFALRPKQWVKNLFVFLPLIFGKKLFDWHAGLCVASGFILFSMTSSAMYLFNDVIDEKADRLHPLKRLRPIAAGKLSRINALAAAFTAASIALIAAFYLNPLAGFILLVYVALNLLYSRFLKTIVIIDVFCLSLFFILRILAGTYLAQVALSPWIILMAGLLALFLGFTKRRQEIKLLGIHSVDHRTVLRKYNRYFIDQMIGVVTSSTVAAYTLYTMDSRTVHEVGSHHMLATVPFVYYGIFRYLYLTHRGRREGDPTRILLMDFPMQMNLLCWILVAIAVIYFHI